MDNTPLPPANPLPPQPQVPVSPSQPPIPPSLLDPAVASQPWWRKNFFLAIIISAFILMGGGAAAYFGYVVPNQPNNVVLKAFDNLVSSPGGLDGFNATFTTDLADSDETSVWTINGGIDQDFNTRLDMDLDSLVFKISGSVLVRPGDKEMYLRVEGAPDYLSAISNDEITGLESLATKLDNSWIRLSVNDLKEAGLIGTTQATTANACVTAIADYLTTKQGEYRPAIVEAYKQHQFMNATKVGGETLNNIPTTKYQVVIDEAKLTAFNQAVVSSLKPATQSISQACGSSEEEVNQAISEGKTETGDSFVWINGDKEMVQISTVLKLDESATTQVFNFSGEAADTSKPATVLTLKQLQTEIEKAFGGELSNLSEIYQ